jgi:glutaminase
MSEGAGPDGDGDGSVADSFVSTGDLPGPDAVRRLVAEAHELIRSVDDGEPSGVYPALSLADPSLFGICVANVRGDTFAVGDSDVAFTIMSVAKPFTFALVCEAFGPDAVREAIGVDATGLPFNSVEAVERHPGGRTNPMVNSGAIATVGLAPGDSDEERWAWIHRGLSAFAGHDLPMDDDTLRSALSTNHRNRAVAQLLQSHGGLDADPIETVAVYTRQSCLSVTARDLAVMGATLADGGVNPATGERVVSADTCRHTLAVMATAGLYETSGDWLFRVGLPGKSGIGGGIVTVSPGKGGLGVFSPPLDEAGNSVRGQLVARFLSARLGLDLFASSPQTADAGDSHE